MMGVGRFPQAQLSPPCAPVSSCAPESLSAVAPQTRGPESLVRAPRSPGPLCRQLRVFLHPDARPEGSSWQNSPFAPPVRGCLAAPEPLRRNITHYYMSPTGQLADAQKVCSSLDKSVCE